VRDSGLLRGTCYSTDYASPDLWPISELTAGLIGMS